MAIAYYSKFKAALMAEPTFTINGVPLTEGQATAVRMAIMIFSQRLVADPNQFGDDEDARQLTEVYMQRFEEVLRLMLDQSKGRRHG